jgi:hypothetical protein
MGAAAGQEHFPGAWTFPGTFPMVVSRSISR